MLIIADSGSTKTNWACLSKDNNILKFATKGYNPFFISNEEMYDDFTNNIPEYLNPKEIKKVFFFGAGCGDGERSIDMSKGIQRIFKNAEITVKSDIYASAYALFGNSSGIACIIGTGSNAAVFDGKNIKHTNKPLGYVLGDEGSATYIAKQVVKKYLRKEFSYDVQQYFDKNIKDSAEEILKNIYSKPFPNRYLASFMPLIATKRDIESINKIVVNSFKDFIDVFLASQKEFKNLPVGFCGSVAFYFKGELRVALNEYGVYDFDVISDPMDRLIDLTGCRI